MNIPEAAEFENYASEIYDRRLTFDGENSVQPRIAVEGDRVYMAYLRADSNIVSMKISDDRGMTWNEPITLLQPTNEVERVEMAADGDNLSVAWEVWTEWFPGEPELTPELHVQYSSDSGDSWVDETYVLDYSCYPSIEVISGDVYLAYLYRPHPPLPIAGSVRLRWTVDGWALYEHDFEIEYGIPEIAVVGGYEDNIIHAVIASEGYMYYTRSDDNGHTWTDFEVISVYTDELPYGYIAMEAIEDRVYIAWSMNGEYNGIALPHKVYGMYAAYEESDGWNFLSFPLVPIDTTVPNVLSSIEGSYDTVLSFQSAREEILHVTEEDSPEWKSYVPDRPDHYNTLKVLNNIHGFWIRMTEDANLTIYGYAPEEHTTTLVLEPGWNMVGYPSISEGNNNLPEEVDIIGYFDETEEYNLAYDHNPETFVFEPGKGYWLYNSADEAVVWTVEY